MRVVFTAGFNKAGVFNKGSREARGERRVRASPAFIHVRSE